MTKVHIVVRRINPAFKIDLVQVGHVKNEQFETLPLSDFVHTPVSDYVQHSDIVASPYIDHCRVTSLVQALIAYPDFSVEFFDNTLVLMFSTNLTRDEGTSKEEGKGH